MITPDSSEISHAVYKQSSEDWYFPVFSIRVQKNFFVSEGIAEFS